MVQDLRKQFEPLTIEKGLDFKVEINGLQKQLYQGDHGRIRQVCSNLLTNALKFTSNGKIEFFINQQDSLNIIVKDTGSGIQKNVMNKVISPFYQVQQSSIQQEGVGLGLAIVDAICKKMDGRLEIESEYGIGTEVKISIPALIKSVDEMIPILEKEPLSDMDLTCCVIDDHNICSQVIGRLIEHMNQKVSIFNDSVTSVDKAIALRPELIFVDINMPQVNGHEWAQLYRDKGGKAILIGMSADQSDFTKSLVLKNTHFHQFLSKPFGMKELNQIFSHFQKEHDQTLEYEPKIHPKDILGLPKWESLSHDFKNEMQDWLKNIQEGELWRSKAHRIQGAAHFLDYKEIAHKIDHILKFHSNEKITKPILEEFSQLSQLFLYSEEIT